MENLENYLNELDKQNKELIITGDLNCDLSIADLQPHSRRLMDIFEHFFVNKRRQLSIKEMS